MKNKIFYSILFLVFISSHLHSQMDSTYYFYDVDRIHRQKTGMQVLAGWSIANIVTGMGLKSNVSGEDEYFNQMNIAWNVFNLGISTLGYLNTHKEQPGLLAMDVFQKQLKLEKSLLFNVGLDISYIFGGLWVLERARNYEDKKEFDRFRGIGRSIILQGAFLFMFDLSFYLIETSSSSRLKETMNLFFINKGQLGMNIKF